MTLSKKISEEQLVNQFREIDATEVYEIKKLSDKILWILKIIKVNFKIDKFIPVSILSTILVDALGVSTTPRSVNNALNPIQRKIHRTGIDGEISCKIMHDGILHLSKLNQTKTKLHTSSKLDQEKNLRTAIQTITKMGIAKDLKPGLYYIVLADLANSTTASTKLDPNENLARIQKFIAITENALPSKPNNFARFIKPNGDGALLLFTNFGDILQWARKLDELCDNYNKKCIVENRPDTYQMFSKKIVHLGEVQFADGYDSISLAVNQTFKIEKDFGMVSMGITDSVNNVIIPRLNSGELSHTEIKKITLHGEKESRPIWDMGY